MDINRKIHIPWKKAAAALCAAALILALICGAVLFWRRSGGVVPGITPQSLPDEDGVLTVCVDAGHGYSDPGSDSDFLGEEYSEKDINLMIAARLCEILRGRGAVVVMTREDDAIPADADGGVYKLDPYMRTDMANGIDGIDVFVSVHCDSFPTNPDVRGLRVHYDSNNTKYTPGLASSIADSCREGLSEYGMPDPKLRMYVPTDGGVYVLRNIKAPSVLVEVGFLSNEADAALMLNEDWRNACAEAIAEGILKYAGK